MGSLVRAEIAVERMTAQELGALGAYELGVAINEIIEDTAIGLRLSRAARDRLMKAKIDFLTAEDDEAKTEAKVARVIAETELLHLRDRAQTMRLHSSLLQSLLRAATII